MFPFFMLFGAVIGLAYYLKKDSPSTPLSPVVAKIRAQIQAHLNGLRPEEGRYVIFDIDDKTAEVFFVGSYDSESQAQAAVKEVGEGLARLYVDRQKGYP